MDVGTSLSIKKITEKEVFDLNLTTSNPMTLADVDAVDEIETAFEFLIKNFYDNTRSREYREIQCSLDYFN